MRKAYLMTTEIDLVREKYRFSQTHLFFNKGKVTFLQMKQDNIPQKCCQKHENRLCKCLCFAMELLL